MKERKPMRVWGGTTANRWHPQIGGGDQIRIIVKAHSKADAMRILEVSKLGKSRTDFDHFMAESGNDLDLALCWREMGAVWVCHDEGALLIWGEWRDQDRLRLIEVVDTRKEAR